MPHWVVEYMQWVFLECEPVRYYGLRSYWMVHYTVFWYTLLYILQRSRKHQEKKQEAQGSNKRQRKAKGWSGSTETVLRSFCWLQLEIVAVFKVFSAWLYLLFQPKLVIICWNWKGWIEMEKTSVSTEPPTLGNPYCNLSSITATLFVTIVFAFAISQKKTKF